MCHKIELQSGAIFIADAHENAHRFYLKEFLDSLDSGQIPTPSQLFLMGDIFDLLVGEVSYTHKIHSQIISRLESLAQKIPIYYLEGNHDFNLHKLFLHVKVISIQDQPLHVKTPKGDLLLWHGDKYGSFSHRFYTKIIRNSFLLQSLNFVDKIFKFGISRAILKNLAQKSICRKIENFKEKTTLRLNQYPKKSVWAVGEGHFHQGWEGMVGEVYYINFPSFACERSYFVVQCAKSMQSAKLQLRGSNV
jgi:UDP-2,3-diacylglucosamine hydrolase